MDDAERLEEIDEILQDLAEMCGDRTVLVEGRNDLLALDMLGRPYDAICVQRTGGPLQAAERVYEGRGKAVVLTDWDGKGDEIAAELALQLDSLCVEYDLSIRERLARVCRKDIKDVEGLPALYRRLSAEAAPKLY